MVEKYYDENKKIMKKKWNDIKSLLKFHVICLLFFFSFLSLQAQRNCKIIYKSKLVMSREALLQYAEMEIKEKYIEERKNADSISAAAKANIDRITEIADVYLAQDSLSLEEVYKEKNFIVSRELKEPVNGRIHKKFNLRTFMLVVVDSFIFHRIDSVRTTIISPDQSSKKEYRIEITDQGKIINGYRCQQFFITIKGLSNDQSQNNFFEVWATKEIKPAVPVYGVLRLGKKILKDYTPLLIKEFMNREAGIFAERSIASIQWY